MIGEGLFDGIDGALILSLLPQKIQQAESLLIDTGLDLEALSQNPDANPAEVEGIRRTFRARRFQYEYLKKRLADLQKAAVGKTD